MASAVPPRIAVASWLREPISGDCHHLKPRAEGGTHDADNLVYLCPAHHRAAHEGRLVIRGSWSEGLGLEHADGAAYGVPHPRADQEAHGAPHPRADQATYGAPHPRADHAELLTSVSDALTGMGFRRREARELIDAARPHVKESDGFEQVLRYALRAVPVPGSVVRESIAPYVRADRAHADRAHADRALADRA